MTVNKMYTALHGRDTKRVQREHDFVNLLIVRRFCVTKIAITILLA